jgi:hypothetical protein
VGNSGHPGRRFSKTNPKKKKKAKQKESKKELRVDHHLSSSVDQCFFKKSS